jgi:inner membrane protein
LLATLAIALVAVPIGYLSGNVLAGVAVPLGHLLATFSDCFTKQGVQLFFPYPAWCISVSNPRRRLKTGGRVSFGFWALR